MINNSELSNVYNWNNTYNNSSLRWKSMYQNHVDTKGNWNGTCIRCNEITDQGRGFRYCDDCYNEYTKIRESFRRKPYSLLKRTNENSVCKITGCNKKVLVYHLSCLFTDNMNWNNYGQEWHIDHRIPLAWFNLENNKEILFACNYKNLQPMLKNQNLDKNADYPKNKLFNYAFH